MKQQGSESGAICAAEPVQDIVDVGANGRKRNAQSDADFSVTEAGSHKIRHFRLSWAQLIARADTKDCSMKMRAKR